MLTIPKVDVIVVCAADWHSLDSSGRDWGRASIPESTLSTSRLAHRDWRLLRAQLINLFGGRSKGNKDQVSKWLSEAGYLPRLRVNGSDRYEPNWKPEYITEEILVWLRKRSRVISWLMTITPDRFRRAIDALWVLVEHQRKYAGDDSESESLRCELPQHKEPLEELEDRLKPPKHLDLKILEEFVTGAGEAPNHRASFGWNRYGKPSVVVYVASPMEAIGLSVHVDRRFSGMRWVLCPKCGKGLDQRKATERFCSAKCRNYFTTNHRRRKLRLVRAGNRAWQGLPQKMRRQKARWKWISSWVDQETKGEVIVSSAWVKKAISTTTNDGSARPA